MFCINAFYINEYDKYKLQIAKYYETNRILNKDLTFFQSNKLFISI